MKDIYSRIKDAKNPSPRMSQYFKSNEHPAYRIYLIAETKSSLNKLKDMFRGRDIVVGFSNQDDREGKVFKMTEINGHWLPNIYCRKGSRQPGPLCFNPSIIVKRGKASAYALDITDQFIERYNKIGMCLLHDSRHELIKAKKPRHKVCKHCQALYKEVVVIKKSIELKLVE